MNTASRKPVRQTSWMRPSMMILVSSNTSRSGLFSLMNFTYGMTRLNSSLARSAITIAR